MSNVRSRATTIATTARLRASGFDAATGEQLARLLSIGGRLQSEYLDGSAFTGLLAELDLLHALIDQVPDQLFVKDLESRFLVANAAVALDKVLRETGEPATVAALIGKTDFDLFPPEIAQGFRDIEVEIMRSGTPRIDMLEANQGRDGGRRWISMTKAPLRDANGKVIGLVAVGHDVTSRKQAEERVQFLAHHDPLTGLANRGLFIESVDRAIELAAVAKKELAVVFIDLDRFKLINDSFGHRAGDELLIALAKRMTKSVRATDVVARLGGDEFVILLSGLPPRSKRLDTIVAKLRANIARPVAASAGTIEPTVSIGVAVYPDDGRTSDELIGSADAAMYRVKTSGRDGVSFHGAARLDATPHRRER